MGGMQGREQLLRQLADGRFHSGQRLAQALGLSRAAVWKQVQRLEADYGLAVSAVRGRGYRLAAPLELLDAACIEAGLSAEVRARLHGLSVLWSTASTNSCAAADPPAESGRARVWLAEHQTAGRGRRGRSWVSAFGENLYLSLAWRFDLPMGELAGLSIVAGVVVAEALQRLGLEGHTLKWPNDVLVDGRKLSGILVEVSGEAGGPATAVLGVGVNFRINEAHAAAIDQPWTDLSRTCPKRVSRNALAGLLIDGLARACDEFSEQRLQPFVGRWASFDRLHGRKVRLSRGQQVIEGVYRGITAAGALVLEQAGGLSEHLAGEVSLRAAGEA
jgi:BirA family biotin operon repressor/biotin-[acetyl-CoA-carboxylase] ligase